VFDARGGWGFGANGRKELFGLLRALRFDFDDEAARGVERDSG
jgi:hypothetical protein